MANKLTIQHKRSSIAGNAPLPAQIAVGELAINFADKKLYTKDGAGVVIPLGSSGSGSSNWTIQTTGISRADRIKVGVNANPVTAVDIQGTSISNVQSTTGTIDVSTGQIWEMTVSGLTNVNFTGTIAGSTTVVLRVSNGAAGSIHWPSNVKWSSGVSPTLTAGLDIVVFITNDGGATWFGSVFAKDSK